ncbi:MAG: tetratricopeptide repeat protein [Deltaproteobacteria bacterium]|uniref:tetratricopeptide repeat protein n=1 Tax=Desulfobacula sp. TaxID=2593537 RepID=UPI00198BE213|nr:tetratricopeptide repeat protein [Candidatus Desulfobacula maris]MBL6993604.1 tetratricopeptide repeat protein [Desulfobacula sp.]
MKNIIFLFFVFLFLVSCSSKNMDMENKKENAIDIQRIGEAHYNSGKYTAALQSLLEAHQIIPNDPYLNNSLGLVYLAKERYDLAENSFKKALELKSDYIHAKNHLGVVYLKQKKWDLAIGCFKEVSDNLLYATPEISFSNLGWAYFHQKKYITAKNYFIKSLEIRPNFLNAIHGLASIYIETGNHNQAIDFLHHALETNPGAAIIHSDMAKVYEALKNFDKARKSWNIVLKLEPATSPLAREALKRLFELN